MLLRSNSLVRKSRRGPAQTAYFTRAADLFDEFESRKERIKNGVLGGLDGMMPKPQMFLQF